MLHFPYCGGHEGAGVVEAVGPGVTQSADRRPHRDIVHPWLRSVPFCGRGMQNLCQTGALLMQGTQLDGTFRMHYQGRP